MNLLGRSGGCAAFAPHIGAFVDGELRGDILRSVSHHIDACASCRRAVSQARGLGDLLRAELPVVDEQHAPDMSGFADGIVSRIKAEERESWRGVWQRATDDLHWVVVGAGSIAASFVSVLMVSVVIQSGIEQRADSLAAVLNYVAVPPPVLGSATVVPDTLGGTSNEIEMASLTFVNDDGHITSLQPVSGGDGREAQEINGQLRGLRFTQQLSRRVTDPDRQFIWLFSSTEVKGKKAL